MKRPKEISRLGMAASVEETLSCQGISQDPSKDLGVACTFVALGKSAFHNRTMSSAIDSIGSKVPSGDDLFENQTSFPEALSRAISKRSGASPQNRL